MRFDLLGDASDGYVREVRAEAADLVERGMAAPWDAIRMAHDIVQKRRRRRVRGGVLRGTEEPRDAVD